MATKNRDKSVERPQNKNLKRDAGPGRPPGQRNYATIYREALLMLAEKNATTPEKLEAEMIANAAVLARKGDYRFYKDVLDRVYGAAPQSLEITGEVKSDNFTPEQRQALLSLLNDKTGS